METHELKPQAQAVQQGRVVTGLALIWIGLLVFLSNWFDIDALFIPLLGATFVLWGIVQRVAGLLIPGGILSGIGLGICLTSQAGQAVDSAATGGIFLLAFAAGWLSVTLLSIMFTSDRLLWPLIPAGIMASIGSAVLLGGLWMEVLAFVGIFWPIGLIGFGLFLLWQPRAIRG